MGIYVKLGMTLYVLLYLIKYQCVSLDVKT